MILLQRLIQQCYYVCELGDNAKEYLEQPKVRAELGDVSWWFQFLVCVDCVSPYFYSMLSYNVTGTFIRTVKKVKILQLQRSRFISRNL